MREPIYKVERYTDIKDMIEKTGEKYADRQHIYLEQRNLEN